MTYCEKTRTTYSMSYYMGFTTLLFAIFLTSCSQQKTKVNEVKTQIAAEPVKVKIKTNPAQSDWVAENLKGGVKQYVDSIYYAVKKGKPPYEKAGFFTERKSTFSEDGFLMKPSEGYCAPSEYEYKFDTSGNVVEKSCPLSLFKYKYDSLGNMIEMAFYKRNDNLSEKHYFKYNSKRERIEESNYSGFGSREWLHKFLKYDNNGKVLEYISYESNSSDPDDRYVYKYDDNGNITDLKEYFIYSGSLFSVKKYLYDYDAHGNWIRRTSLEGSDLTDCQPTEITERQITYY
jgi:hypothetical protein